MISPRNQFSEGEKVVIFLDMDRGTWDSEKVGNTFIPYEAEVVLGIPISLSLSDDSRT